MRPDLLAQLGLPLLAFGVATGLATLAGIGELGEAATVGQLAFAVVLVAVLVRGPASRRG
ncbi:MAG: hypothetical protein AVDCRST_MAG45-1377 [uncultured Solirubrobacterales bacterium]|uniref:Uncharacterized protein n=1 Tax=uncultured Solirubrobacterales bacterium TaxID=768556 RepID=A0A6J4SLT8_9ACTN|nr:MAG: hypothetical protein AVDCRST_MAG45-1377 [uncultured Solirubrobacterales bacterium]